MIPLLGIPVSVGVLYFGNKASQSPDQIQNKKLNRTLAIVSIVVSGFTLILGVANAAVGAYQGATGKNAAVNKITSSLSQSAVSTCNTDPTVLAQQVTKVSYKQLEKDPNSFSGTVTTFTGQVLQIQQSGNDGVMRLSVTNKGYGIWSPSDVIYVTYHQPTDAVDDDIVSVTGTLTGSETYTSQAGFQITIPSMDVCSVNTAPTKSAPATKTTSSATPQKTAAPAVTAQPPVPTYTTPSRAVVNTGGTVVSQPPAPPASWHTAYTYSSSATIHTPPFSLQGQQQKIAYTCSLADSSNTYGSTFNGIIQSITSYQSDVFAWEVACPTSNSTYEYSLPPGQYYLDLSSTNASYTVSIEDYY